MTFYDTHAHLDYPEFQAELPEVLARAKDAGITRILSVGTDLESSKRALQIAEANDMVYAVVGWHPSYAMEAPEDIRPKLRELASHPKVVALGETGFDYYRLPSKSEGKSVADDLDYKAKQRKLFTQHLEIAAETGLNCVIHQRVALGDTLETLSPFSRNVRGVFHCFVDDLATAEKILAINSLVSFTGILTFKNAPVVHDTFKKVPLGKFMFETDCPYLAPVPFRGKRCEPAYVSHIAQFASTIRNASVAELSAATCATAHEFFPKLK